MRYRAIGIWSLVVIIGLVTYHIEASNKIANRMNTDTTLRKIKTIINSSTSKMGFITMKQPLPARTVDQIDPFLLLHHHGPHTVPANNNGLPFGPHPHRGFETVTFIYHGDVKHRDSKGFESVIKSGGIQWMTAGKGIVHSERSSEEFKQKGGELELIQIWVNLPARQKSATPVYHGLQKADIPTIKNDKFELNVASGTWGDTKVAEKGLYPVDLANLTLEEGAEYEWKVAKEKNILFYILNGSVDVNGLNAGTHQMVVFENTGDRIVIKAKTKTKILLGAAMPINEPVVAQGPFVMNSEQEIREAILDYQQGKMGVLEE